MRDSSCANTFKISLVALLLSPYLTRHDLMFLISQSVAFKGVADPCS